MADQDIELAAEIARYYDDPLGFVRVAWPWGEPGPLEQESGPDANQEAFLRDLGALVKQRGFNGRDPVMPILMAASSGHGTGKSVLGAWVAWWIISTRPDSIGTVTAGTFTQLESRTWAAIQYWGKLCITARWFDIQSAGVYSKSNPETWKIVAQTCKEENAQSFAGQHARNSTSWYMADEASEVPDKIFDVMAGGLTDGEPMLFIWGQMVRSSGKLYRVCFGDEQKNWNVRCIDSRQSRFTNKALIQQWIEEYGEDSDFVRVRVLGLPPRASELSFIGQDLVDGARKRQHTPLDDEPLVWGYDAANGGQARHCLWARRGLDAASIPPIFLPGDTPRDVVVGKIISLLADKAPGRRAAALFGDQAFGAVVLERVRNSGYTNVFEVNFGDSVEDRHYLNRRAQMWGRLKEWLRLGAIPDEPKLYTPFTDPGFHHRNGRLVLESKQDMAKRGVKSPDGPDALALTFAQIIPPPAPVKPKRVVENAWV